MAETTADVRRDIEMTRERMSETLAQLEHKLNVMQVVREHPWPAIAVAVGTGIALSGSRADVKAAAATVAATQGASGRVGTLLDDVVASLVTGVTLAFQSRIEGWVDELKNAIGAPQGAAGARRGGQTVRSERQIDLPVQRGGNSGSGDDSDWAQQGRSEPPRSD
ncbi:MAG TPA: DUF3618 domain-containing protein [Gemmatimonadaceae bacterium]|nr:DUF3618 domain-containing protein [Gemmatimonadaceae bacterium]